MTSVGESARLVTELGQAVLADQSYVDRDWQAIAIVFTLDGGTSMSGYVYDADGEWEAEIPESFNIFDNAEALQAAMERDGAGKWKTCLLQISRPGPKLTIDFDYEDGDRWAITPGNLLDRVEELRPR